MSSAAAIEAVIAQVCEGIAADGRAVVADFLPTPLVAALATEAGRRAVAGEFSSAGIGHGESRVERSDIRGDRILWLDEHALSSPECALWAALEALRAALNRVTFLGLFSFEGHYALYPPGAFYRRHRDRLQWIAQFMTEHCQEFVLGMIGGLGRLPRRALAFI